MEQRTESWLEARRGKITSSVVSNLLGVKALGKTGETYALKLITEQSLLWEFEENYISHDMQRGIDLEPIARERYEEETFNEVEEVGFVSHNDYEGTSPDGLVGEDGMIEIKCPKVESHVQYMLGRIPKNYIDQMQHQMYVTGRKWNDFVSYNESFHESKQIYIQRFEADPKWVEKYEARREEFLTLKTELNEKFNTNRID